jgi:squalene monooxygenase
MNEINVASLWEKPQVCIAGAGVAGAALGAFLARNGLRVTIIEKDWNEQQRIVGELLQPGGIAQLAAMGLEDALNDIDAQPIYGYAVFSNKKQIAIEYPKNESGNTTTGRGFHNGKFLQNLRHALIATPHVVCERGEVVSLLEENNVVKGLLYKKSENGEALQVTADITIVADGIFSTLRNGLNSAQKEVTGFFIGLLLKNVALPSPNYGHVFTGGATPVLAYPISNNEVRILADFPGSNAPRKGSALKKYLHDLVGNQLPENMRVAFNEAVEAGKMKFMPNHRLSAKPNRKKGAVMLGDALNMRHPLTGGGMTVALTDVHLLGKEILSAYESHYAAKEKLPAALEKAVINFYAKRADYDASINILANALYDVFKHEDLKEACVNYLQQGGNYSQGPVSLLSGLNRNTNVLMSHFFAVALHGAKNTLAPFPTPGNIKDAYKMIKDAVNIVSPLVKSEKPNTAITSGIQLAEKIML